MELSTARREFDAYLALHRSAGTRRLYNDRLSITLQGLGVARPSAVSLGLVHEYLVVAKQNYAISTLNGDIRILKSFFSWLVSLGEFEVSPLAGLKSLPDTADPKRRALTEPEIKRLIKTDRGLIWEFFISTGVRKNEFISLLVKDFDWDAGVVSIRRSIAKRNRDRRIPVVGGLMRRVRGNFNGAAPNSHAFRNGAGRPWRNYLLKALRTDLKTAKIRSRGVDLHALRKTFATRMIHRGVDPRTVQYLMGHATLEMTMAIYVEAQAENSPAVLGALEMPK